MISNEAKDLINMLWHECDKDNQALEDALSDGEYLDSIGVDDKALVEEALYFVEHLNSGGEL